MFENIKEKLKFLAPPILILLSYHKVKKKKGTIASFEHRT